MTSRATKMDLVPPLNPGIVAINAFNAKRAAYVSELLKNPMIEECAVKTLLIDQSQLHSFTAAERIGGFKALKSFSSIVLSFAPMKEAIDASERIIARTNASQRAKAKNGRIRIGEAGPTLRALIASVCLSHERKEYSSKELWPHFVAAFASCDPEADVFDLGDNAENWKITYCSLPRHSQAGILKERSISYRRFRTIVSELRKKGR